MKKTALLNDDMNSVGALQCSAPMPDLGIIRSYRYSATPKKLDRLLDKDIMIDDWCC
jgi:hypothetical protein